MIQIAELLPSQNYLRRTDYMEDMIKFVRGGGFFTQDMLDAWAAKNNYTDARVQTPTDHEPLIYISQFEDGVKMIHDGLHRVVGVFLGGRDTLRDDECVLRNWTYADYLKVDFEHGFVTPFDVRNECRIANFSDWKKKVIAMSLVDHGLAMDEIKKGAHNYCEPRMNRTVRQVATEYQRLHKPKPKKGVIRPSGTKRTELGFELGQDAANAANLEKISAVMAERGVSLDEEKATKLTKMASELLNEQLRLSNPNLAEIIDEKNRLHFKAQQEKADADEKSSEEQT